MNKILNILSLRVGEPLSRPYSCSYHQICSKNALKRFLPLRCKISSILRIFMELFMRLKSSSKYFHKLSFPLKKNKPNIYTSANYFLYLYSKPERFENPEYLSIMQIFVILYSKIISCHR